MASQIDAVSVGLGAEPARTQELSSRLKTVLSVTPGNIVSTVDIIHQFLSSHRSFDMMPNNGEIEAGTLRAQAANYIYSNASDLGIDSGGFCMKSLNFW